MKRLPKWIYRIDARNEKENCDTKRVIFKTSRSEARKTVKALKNKGFIVKLDKHIVDQLSENAMLFRPLGM